jgi:hypothetical protein
LRGRQRGSGGEGDGEERAGMTHGEAGIGGAERVTGGGYPVDAGGASRESGIGSDRGVADHATQRLVKTRPLPPALPNALRA